MVYGPSHLTNITIIQMVCDPSHLTNITIITIVQVVYDPSLILLLLL